MIPSNNNMNNMNISKAFEQSQVKGPVNDKAKTTGKGSLGAKIKLAFERIGTLFKTGEWVTNGKLLNKLDSRIKHLTNVLAQETEKEPLSNADKDIVKKGIATMRFTLEKLKKSDVPDAGKKHAKEETREKAFERIAGDLNNLQAKVNPGSQGDKTQQRKGSEEGQSGVEGQELQSQLRAEIDRRAQKKQAEKRNLGPARKLERTASESWGDASKVGKKPGTKEAGDVGKEVSADFKKELDEAKEKNISRRIGEKRSEVKKEISEFLDKFNDIVIDDAAYNQYRLEDRHTPEEKEDLKNIQSALKGAESYSDIKKLTAKATFIIKDICDREGAADFKLKKEIRALHTALKEFKNLEKKGTGIAESERKEVPLRDELRKAEINDFKNEISEFIKEWQGKIKLTDPEKAKLSNLETALKRSNSQKDMENLGESVLKTISDASVRANVEFDLHEHARGFLATLNALKDLE